MKIEELPHMEGFIRSIDVDFDNSGTILSQKVNFQVQKEIKNPTAQNTEPYILILKKDFERFLKRPKSSNPLMAEFENFE